MAYFIRVLGKRDPDIPISIINDRFKQLGIQVSVKLESGTSESWSLITLSDYQGYEVVQIERNSTYGDALGYDELLEFKKEIDSYKPNSAVQWLKNFFETVEVIYAFQIFDFPDQSQGWQIIGEVKSLIMSITQGIIQSDNEGFSNEEGYHILWQFPDDVQGEWSMAVLNPLGYWTKFKMDLGNIAHRSFFMDGKIPNDLQPL